MTGRGIAAPRVLSPVVVALLALGGLGACTQDLEPDPQPDPAVTSTPRPDESPAGSGPPSADGLRAVAQDTGAGILVVPADGVVPVATSEEPDGSRRLTWTTAGGAAAEVAVAPAVHLVAPEGWTLMLADDRSVVARDADDVARAGLAPPETLVPDGAVAPRVVLEGVADDVLTLTLDAGAQADDARIGEVDLTLWVSATGLGGTDWGDREGGRSLAVVPSDWARGAGEAGLAVLWAQLRTVEPEADTPVMYDQLVCHSIGAPGKETWNLEPWRPDVGLLGVLAAACNPT